MFHYHNLIFTVTTFHEHFKSYYLRTFLLGRGPCYSSQVVIKVRVIEDAIVLPDITNSTTNNLAFKKNCFKFFPFLEKTN